MNKYQPQNSTGINENLGEGKRMDLIAYIALLVVLIFLVVAFCVAMGQIYANKKAIKEIIAPMGLEFNEDEDEGKPALRKRK